MLVDRSTKTDQDEISVARSNSRLLSNSDRIKIKFGSYGIDISENNSTIRVSNLYSIDDGIKTNRTFAVVAYPQFIEPAFVKEHEAIINGQSIGVVFENNGWAIHKYHQYFGEIEVPPEYSGSHSLFSSLGTNSPAIHIYTLVVKKDQYEFEYAFIAEVHHSEFLQLEELKSIYADESNSHPSHNQSVSDFLDVVKSKIQVL